MIEMQFLKPVPIPTRGVGRFRALWRWIRVVRKWELTAQWQYVLSDKTKIVIPARFEFDGASIPRPFWAILSPVGLLLIPGLIHDFAYRFDFLLEQPSDGGPLKKYRPDSGRRFWDRLFRDVAIEVNGFKIINSIAWVALRIGGRWAWNKRRRNPHPEYWQVPHQQAAAQVGHSA